MLNNESLELLGCGVFSCLWPKKGIAVPVGIQFETVVMTCTRLYINNNILYRTGSFVLCKKNTPFCRIRLKNTSACRWIFYYLRVKLNCCFPVTGVKSVTNGKGKTDRTELQKKNWSITRLKQGTNLSTRKVLIDGYGCGSQACPKGSFIFYLCICFWVTLLAI